MATNQAKPYAQPSDSCSYARQDHRRIQPTRRHQLLSIALWLICSAFTWPGRVPHLRYLAGHGSMSERVAALRLLEEYPSQASSDTFLAALEDDSGEVRVQAALSVAAVKDPRAAANLLDLARSRDADERAAALKALGCLGLDRALPVIEQALRDPNAEVRSAAVDALRPFVAAGKLDSAVLAEVLNADTPALRLEAARLLDLIPGASPPDATLALLRQAARDQSSEVRAMSVRAMGRLHDARLLTDLQKALADPEDSVRLWAIAALGDSNLVGAIDALRARIRASEQDVRAARAAVAALGRIDDAGALSALIPLLTQTSLAASAASALSARARRLRDARTLQQSVEALQRAIEAATPGQPLAALAQGLLDLAPFADVKAARLSLRSALEQGRGDTVLLTRQLLDLDASALVSALVERLRHTPDAQTPNVLAAVVLGLASETDPGSALETHAAELRAQLSRLESAPASPELLQLRALLDPKRQDAPSELRRALATAAATLPALARERIPAEALLRLLDDPDPQTRQLASDALARSAGPDALPALFARLDRGAPQPVLTLQACAGLLYRYRESAAVPPELRERLVARLRALLDATNTDVALNALYALRANRDARTAPWIAGLLRGNSPALRAAALQALGDFELTDARRLLRETLRTGNPRQAVNAAIALGEVGTDRDVAALQRAAERGVWPLPPAAAYAAARITQRGATRKHSLERVLCRFAQQRDTYVLANIVSALAALGADSCDEHITPELLIAASLPSALRVSAARWLQSARPRSPEASAARAELLERCASDLDPAVANACLPAPALSPTGSGETLIRARDTDHSNPWRSRVVALRFPDGTAYIGRSDDAGQVLLPRATRGAILLEDPADHGIVALPTPLQDTHADLHP